MLSGSHDGRPRLRLGLAGAVAALLAGGALGGSIAPDVTAGTGQSQRVTLRAHPTIVSSGPVELSGEIESPVAGEVVDIQAKDCGQQFFRGRAGTTTTGGGRWSTLLYPQFSTTLRAVWKDHASAPVTVWLRAYVTLRRASKGRLSVFAGGPFWRKKVQIQQRKAGAWKTVKTVVLTMDGNLDRTYFKVSVPRGTLLRAVLPKSSAKPCYLQGTSTTLRT